MKAFLKRAVLFLSLSGVSLAGLPERLSESPGLPFVPNKFIIEVDDLARIPNKRSFTRSLDLVYASLRERAVALDVVREFDSAGLFTGAAVVLKDANDVAVIEEISGVKAIRPVMRIPAPDPKFYKKVDDPNDPAVPADSFSTHVMTGVDKLHAEGITGKGVKIGIIDTGIDYTHPSLGGKFGPGNKVAGGSDLVGDDYNGHNTPVPDSDPLDQCNGHGTHVAGIIGANPGNIFNIVGVAPDSTLSAYRVFGCTGSVDDDVMVDALLLGAKDGQDILTISIGGPFGWTESTSQIVASRIARSGKIVTIAAGNSGSDGSWYTSNPGNAIDAISVASVDNTIIPLQSALVEGVEKDPIVYYSTFPLDVTETLPIYATSNDTTNPADACEPLPDSTPDLSGFVVIIRRGTCPFVTKLENAAEKGAKYALIYNNQNGLQAIDVGDFLGSAALIQAADGVFLVEQWVAGAPVTLSFPQTGGSVDFPSETGGLVSSFSTYGPTNDFYFKPSIGAPGGNILSTVPVDLGSFALQSGTSMATPFVAGVSALLFQAKGKSPEVGRAARTLFESTAKYVPSSLTDGDPLQTLTQQGAGLINAFDAIHSTTILSKGELVLNDTANFKAVQTFTVTNRGDKSKDYSLSHIIAGTALTFIPGSPFTAFGPVPLSKTGGSAAISPATFTLGSGRSQEVTVRFSPPTGLDATTFPVFSGFIQVSAPSEPPVHVSYIGGVGSLKDVKIVDTSGEVIQDKIPAIFDANGEVQVAPTNYTFGIDDYPSVVWRQNFGSPLVRIDLVDPDIKIVSTIVPRAFEARGEPLFTFPFDSGRGSGGGTFAQVKIVGPLAEFEYLSRNDDDLSATGNGFNFLDIFEPIFANGTTIPNNSYRVLFRVLKVTGDRKKQEDYETWLSPIVGVQAG